VCNITNNFWFVDCALVRPAGMSPLNRRSENLGVGRENMVEDTMQSYWNIVTHQNHSTG
jgi:hypothetical protein